MSVLDLIGNTPVVEITNLADKEEVKVYAKLEGNNPCGSVKDRIAKYMIEKAEEDGELTKDKIILEPTSGNTGIGLAMVAATKGYKIHIVMPETMSIERRQILQTFGAELILTPGGEGMTGAIKRAQDLAQSPKYFMPDQFANPANVLAHYEGTGKEILEQVGSVDVFVAGLGTSGTIMGAGKRLKEANPQVKLVGVEPYPKSKIQGLRNMSEGYRPPIYKEKMLDEKVNINDNEAFCMARRLTQEEGLFAGISSGAAVFEAMKQAEKMEKGTLVVVLPDRGDRYLSVELFCPKCPVGRLSASE